MAPRIMALNESPRSKPRGINREKPIERRSKLRGIQAPIGGLNFFVRRASCPSLSSSLKQYPELCQVSIGQKTQPDSSYGLSPATTILLALKKKNAAGMSRVQETIFSNKLESDLKLA
jgi:hypothetical protein